MEDAVEEAARLRAWIRSHLDEVRRLARIVGALALLAKAEAGLVRLEQRLVRLDELVPACRLSNRTARVCPPASPILTAVTTYRSFRPAQNDQSAAESVSIGWGISASSIR